MDFEVIILGSASASPKYGRNPTAQLLSYGNEHFLIDCGEATQYQLLKYKLKSSRIENIFISHLHGDHYFGLFGLLSTFSLEARSKPLRIFAPAQLAEVLLTIQRIVGEDYGYELIFMPTCQQAQVIWENQWLRVRSFPLKHSLPTTGFCFEEKQDRINIRKEWANRLTLDEILALKAGKNLEKDGQIIPNEQFVVRHKPRSYAFCSDTAYFPEIIPHIKGVDLLYHEATFLERDAQKAEKTNHSTAYQAALIAKNAAVKKLLIGHFSARYRNEDESLMEARSVFEHSFVAHEGQVFSIES